MKIRCRSRRTSSSTVRQSTASQSRAASSGPFTTTSVAAASNLPIGSDSTFIASSTGSPDPRGRPFGPGNRPYPASYPGSHQRRSWSYGRRFPAAFRRTGIRFLGHRSPAEGLGLPRGRLTGRPKGPDLNGVVMLRMSKTRPGRTPPLPRGRWCAPGRRLVSGRRPPLSSGQSLRPRWNYPSAGVTFTRHQRRFTRFAHHPGNLTATGAGEQAPRRSSPRR